MVLQRPLTIVFCAVVFASGAASGEVVMKAVDDQVSFRPDKPLPSPLTSIIWKHRNSDNVVVKAIEWEDGDISILNPRFKGVTSVDEKTGQITITNLKHEHSGVYFMEINSKEQEQIFTLTVKDPVPQPEINIEQLDNPDVVYLRCEYSETIIWKNSAGETLTGSPIGKAIGESILVEKALETNPEKFYTCTLDNGASKKTSDPVYVKDLFEGDEGSRPWWIAIIVILIIGIIIGIGIALYKHKSSLMRQYFLARTSSDGTPMDTDKSTAESTKPEDEVEKGKQKQQPVEDSSHDQIKKEDESSPSANNTKGTDRQNSPALTKSNGTPMDKSTPESTKPEDEVEKGKQKQQPVEDSSHDQIKKEDESSPSANNTKD